MQPKQEKPSSWIIEGIPVSIQLLDPSLDLWAAKVGNSLFLRHKTLDTAEKAKRFHKALLSLGDSPLKLSVMQLGLPEKEWEACTAEHILLSEMKQSQGLSFQVAHLNFPMPALYHPKELDLEFQHKLTLKLSSWQNLDAWEIYSYWLHEEMESILERFPLESTEIYTLQAFLLDFIHEVRGSLLQSYDNDITDLLLQEGQLRQLLMHPIKNLKEDALLLEKRIIKRRAKMKESLAIQSETLGKIFSTLAAIEKNHAELQRFKMQVRLLKNLLDAELNGIVLSSVEKALCLFPLHEELKIISSFSCATETHRSALLFGLYIALAVTSNKTSLDAVAAVALKPSDTLRTLFMNVIEKLCQGKEEIPWQEDWVVEKEILKLFPEKTGKACLTRLQSL